MSNSVGFLNSQPFLAQQHAVGYGVGFASEVVEVFGGRLVSLVESKLSALPGDYDAAMAKLDEVEGIIRSATKVPVWAQRKALRLLKKWASEVETATQRPLGERVKSFSTAIKFYEMASTATKQAYGAMEELSDQTVGLDAGTGEIYLDHYLTLASSLPLLSDALALEGDHDRSGVLKEVEWIQTALEDEGKDLIKAIGPEIDRAIAEYWKVRGEAEEALKSEDTNRMMEAYAALNDAIVHNNLIYRMNKQKTKLLQIADRLSGPLKGIGQILRNFERQIPVWRVLDIGHHRSDLQDLHMKTYRILVNKEGGAVKKYIEDCKNRFGDMERGDHQALISFKRLMSPLFLVDSVFDFQNEIMDKNRQPAIEILARAEGLSADSYDYRAKNTKEMQKAYLFNRMTPEQKAKYKELTTFESEPKGSKFAWLFLGLQALTMLRGAGSMLLGYDAAALASQAKQMRENLFNALDPNLKAEIEKDGAKMGTLLSDKWDQLKTMGEGSMQNGLQCILSPQAQEMVRGLVRGLETAPTAEKIRAVQDALITSRLVEHIPPVRDTSIGEWIELFTRAEEAPVKQQEKVSEVAGQLFLPNPEVAPRTGELSKYLDQSGPAVDKSLLLHLGGREFGHRSGLEGYNELSMLSYLQQQVKMKLAVMPLDSDRAVFQKLSDKMGQALHLGVLFWQNDLGAFRAELEKELDALPVGETLFWQGGWTLPEDASGHSVVYEVLRDGKDSFTFRIYNRGDGIRNHAWGSDQKKTMVLGFHEVVGVKRSNLVRPSVIQALQELKHAPKEDKKWNPAEIYYNILLRMEGKISQRKIPVEEALPLIGVGICTFSSLSALFHEFLGSDRLYARFMIELEAKGALDYWQQNRNSLKGDPEARELLIRVARQTIQDAMAAASPERNLLSIEELNFIRTRMETILQGVKRVEYESRAALAGREVYKAKVQSHYSDLFFLTKMGKYSDLTSVKKVPPAPRYNGLQLPKIAGAPKMAKEVAKLLHQGNLESRSEMVRLATHEYVRGLPLNIAEQISEEQALGFVDDLVQIANEFQWSLHDVFTAETSRTYRLPLRDAAVPIKLLTIADSIARKYKDSVGIALPDLLQHQMTIVLFGLSAFGRVDDPPLEDDLEGMRRYWEKVDPDGVKRFVEKSPSLFAFEWAQAGYRSGHWKDQALIAEDVELARKYHDGIFVGRNWPFVQWTIDYLSQNPDKSKLLIEQCQFLRDASPIATALAAVADEYKGAESRAKRLQGVLPQMFFHLWDLSFISNYLFTGGWNSKDIQDYNENKLSAIKSLGKEQRLLKRPTRYLNRDVKRTDEGLLYLWEFDYFQYGHLAGDMAQERTTIDQGQIIKPWHVLSKAYGDNDGSFLDFIRFKYSFGERFRYDPKTRPLSPDTPREKVQKLLGTSSKADLQIEETLAYFYNNPMWLSQWEHRDFLNYMLFEQGILLAEIRKRSPEELSELVDAIAHLMKKGNHYFGEILGNVEVQGYFLDLTAKCRHYLHHAGADRELIDRLPDPIPALRDLVNQSGLKPDQRTYLRYVLAKHLANLSEPAPEDLAEIVAFAIQFDLHPLFQFNNFFSAFDDEIRRDMLLNLRPKLHAALMGEGRDRLLNGLLKAVKPDYAPRKWRAHGDFPLFQSEDGQITFDVLKGSYFELGRVPRFLPLEVQSHLKDRQLLSQEELQGILAVQLDSETYEFSLKDGSRMIFRLGDTAQIRGGNKDGVKTAQIQRQIGDRMYQLQEKPEELMFDNLSLVSGNHVWFYSGSNYLTRHLEALIVNAKTGEHRYRISYEGKRATVHQIGTGLVMARVEEKGAFGFLTKMESPEWIRAWADPKSGKLRTVELPRFSLSFTVDEADRINCDQLPGYFLSQKQRHPYLGKIENYFVLDRIDRDQNTKQVIMLPLQLYEKSENRALAPSANIERKKYFEEEQRYALFDVDEAKQRLIRRTIEGRFFLGATYLWHHDYSLAAELIRGYGGQRAGYSPAEQEILERIMRMHVHNADHTPQGHAVGMIAFAALIRNAFDFKGGRPFLLNDRYVQYLHQLEYAPELALTEAEEKLIGEHFGIDFSKKEPILSMKNPESFGTRISSDGYNFFVALDTKEKWKGILRSGLDGETFLKLYEAIHNLKSGPNDESFLKKYEVIIEEGYRTWYKLLTGTVLPSSFKDAKSELITALKMMAASGSSMHARILAHVLGALLVSKKPFPTAEEIKRVHKETSNTASWEKKEEFNKQKQDFFSRFDLAAFDPQSEFPRASGEAQFVKREPYLPRQIAPMEPEEATQHSVKLTHAVTLQGAVIENFDRLIETRAPKPEQIAQAARVTSALEKIFQVKTGEPLADAQLDATVKGVRAYGDSGEAKPAPQYSIKDLQGLKELRLQLEQQLFLMNGAESTACMKLLGKEGANRLPADPTTRAHHLAKLTSGAILPIRLDNLALALIDRSRGVAKIKALNPGLSAKEIDGLMRETIDVLIHATERRRRQAVVEAIKDLEQAALKGAPAQEISNLAAQMKTLSEAVREFNPDDRPEYLVFEYYIGILLQGRQVEGLDKLMQKVRRGEKIHSRELSNVLEMIMGSGKTAVLTPLIAWLEANGVQISLIVMPEGLMPEKTEELEQRFGEAFGRSIDVLTFDRDSDFDVPGLRRLLTRLKSGREEGKLTMVSSSSLQSLILRFVEDILHGAEPGKVDLFRQVLAELRRNGSVTFDELDSIADVLKLLIFSMEKPGVATERQLANTQLKETTAELFKFLFTDKELAPIVSKPVPAEVHNREVKPRLLRAILEGKIGQDNSELNQFLKTAKTDLVRDYLLDADNSEAFAFVDKLESMTLKNSLAVLKYQLNKMIPETFSRKVGEHYTLINGEGVNEETKLLSKPLEKGSWDIGSEHGTAEEAIDYSLLLYMTKGVPEEFVHAEVAELRGKLLASLDSGELEKMEDSPYYGQLMALTGGKAYRLDEIRAEEIKEITARINQDDPVQIINLAMKYAIHPQLAVFPYQLRADAQMLLQIAMVARGFSGTLWNWQTFASQFSKIELSDTEAKTLHLLQANSPQEVDIIEPGRDPFEQIFQGKPSIPIADIGNVFGDMRSEEVARNILEKGPWKGVPYYDEKNKLLVALRNRPSEPLASAGVAKEDRAPYWKQELCTGSDIPIGTSAEAVVTFGRYTMMRDLLQTVWRLRKLDKGQKVRFAVAAADANVIVDTLEKLLKRKIEKLDLSHLLLYSAYIQAMRIGDDNHRSLGQQLRGQLIAQIFDVITQPEVTPAQVIEIIQATQDLFLTTIDPNPYNRYGIRESMRPAKEVVDAELKEVLESKPMKALRQMPILKQHCNADEIEQNLRKTAEAMLPQMAKLLASPTDTGIHLKVKTKVRTKVKTQSQTQTKTQTQTQVQQRIAKKPPAKKREAIHWTKERLFTRDLLKPIPATEFGNATIDTLPASQVAVAEALIRYNPIGSIFDPHLLSSLNRMPIYRSEGGDFIPNDEWEDMVTNHALLIEDQGEIRLMLLDQDDASDIQALLHEQIDGPRLALIDLATDKIWRQGSRPFNPDEVRQNGQIQSLKAQAKMVNGMLSYTEAEKKGLLEFLEGKDVKAIREWFIQVVLANRELSLKRFPTSDLERIFQKALSK